MPLIFRVVKGTPLTFLEGDDNLRYLEGLIISSSADFSNWTGSISSQFAGTASLAITASYALNTGTTVDTGSLVLTSSFNTFTSSYYNDSSSFDQRISSISFDSSSLATTESFDNFTSSYYQDSSSFDQRINSISFDSSSLATTESLNLFTSSYYQDSASFDQRISSISFDSSSLLTTESFNNFTSSYNTGSFTGSFTGQLIGTASWANNATNALTANFVNLIQGPGIIINGLEITSSIRTVNGIFPTDGNIPISLSATVTGTSASLASSGSGNITGSIPDGLVWIISNDPTPSNNGDVYIYSSGSVGAWYQIAPLDQAASDARYIKLDGANTPMTGDLNMGGNNINNVGNMNGTASFATSASFAISASWAPFIATDTGSLLLTSSFNAFTSSYNTGSFTGSFTGELIGTASWSNNAITASYILNAVSASFASTASFVQIAQTASYVLNAVTASHLIGYSQDSSSFDQRINNISFDTSSLPTPAITVNAATTAALPRTPVYNNGLSGVGAFISASTNGTLGAIDGITLVEGDRILVKNQAAQLQNGIYEIITTGSASTRYVMSRSLDSDETSELDSQIVIPSFGSTNAGGIFAQNTNNPIVGTSNIVYQRQTSTLVSQNTAGTQAIYQIPWWTGTARDLSRGSTHFRYINVTSGTTVTTSSLQLTGSFNLSGSAFVRGLTTASQTNVLTYDSSTGQIFFTASSAIGGGGGGSTPTGSLLTTASVSSNTITFTKGDGSTFPITVDTGSGGGSGLSGGTQYYVPVWIGATTLGTSSLYESGSVLKTISGSSDVGLKLDFANDAYTFGNDPNGTFIAVGANPSARTIELVAGNNNNVTSFVIDDVNQLIKTYNQGNDIGLKLDFANNKYWLGNHPNNTHIQLDDANKIIYLLGGNLNNTRFLIDDTIGAIATEYQSNTVGLELNFSNSRYSFGDFGDTSGSTKLVIDDNARTVTVSGSTILSGSLFVNNLTTGSTSNVLTYDTTTGQVFITASSAVGGTTIDTGSFLTTGSLSTTQQLSGSLNITGSLNFFSGSTNAAQIENGWVVLTYVSTSLDFANDTAAAAGGVPLGGLYRNGNAISIRIA